MKIFVFLLVALVSQPLLAVEPNTEEVQVSQEDRLEKLHADVALISKKLRLLQVLFVTQGYPMQQRGYPLPPQYSATPRFSGDWNQYQSMIDNWFNQSLIGWGEPTDGGVHGGTTDYVNCMARCRSQNCRGKSGAGYCGDWFHCNEDCHVTCSQ
jgi:hypothetical protein